MLKVLLVEDEAIIRRGLMFSFDWAAAGCTVIGEASDGEEGVEKIRALAPDIVLTDVRMPILDGLAMLEATKEEFGYEAVILSSYSEFSYAQRAISLGVKEYVLKPVDYDKLKGALEKAGDACSVRSEVAATPMLSSPANVTNPYTKRLLRRIETDYTKRISITELSAEFGVSHVYLQNKFKEDTGYTFHDYLTRYRMMQAMQFLRTGEKRIYEVAEMVGFQDYKYFTAVFKKYVGISPGKFR